MRQGSWAYELTTEAHGPGVRGPPKRSRCNEKPVPHNQREKAHGSNGELSAAKNKKSIKTKTRRSSRLVGEIISLTFTKRLLGAENL